MTAVSVTSTPNGEYTQQVSFGGKIYYAKPGTENDALIALSGGTCNKQTQTPVSSDIPPPSSYGNTSNLGNGIYGHSTEGYKRVVYGNQTWVVPENQARRLYDTVRANPGIVPSYDTSVYGEADYAGTKVIVPLRDAQALAVGLSDPGYDKARQVAIEAWKVKTGGTSAYGGNPGGGSVVSSGGTIFIAPTKTISDVASDAAKDRPNWYDTNQIGDKKSEAIASGLAIMGSLGMGNPAYATNKEYAKATALETLRQVYGGTTTPTGDKKNPTKKSQYYGNELEKLVQQPIETASEYHYLTKAAGIAAPANPWEYQADLAVEFLKGKPQKASEQFSPVSGEMSKYLPNGGTGLQPHRWDIALNTDNPEKYPVPEAVSFLPAIDKLYSAQGQYGPYGSLYGGPDYVGTPSSDGLRKQPDFVFTDAAKANVITALKVSEAERQRTANGGGVLSFISGTNVPDEMAPLSSIAPTTPVDRIVGSKMVASVPVLQDVAALPSPFVSTSAPVTPTQPSIYGGAIDFIGNGVSKGLAAGIVTAPLAIGFDIVRGKSGGVSQFASDVNNIFFPSTAEKNLVSPTIYETNLAAYETKLSGYNTRLKGYNTALTDYQNGGSVDQNKYASLLAASNSLDAEYAGLTEQQKTLESQREKVGVAPSIFDKIGAAHDALNKAFAPYTTDIAGIGSMTDSLDITGDGAVPEILRFTKGAVVSAYQSPVIVAESAIGAMALSYGGHVVGAGVAKAATSNLPVFTQVGKALSTPLAYDVANVAKAGVGAYMIGATGLNIIEQPTSEKKGKATGEAAAMFIGFGAGMAGTKYPAADNPYALRTFFSGERKLPATEKLMIRLGDTVNGITQTKGQKTAIREVSSEYFRNLFTKPEKTLDEPSLMSLKKITSQSQADAIDAAILEQPSVKYGSGTIEAQIGNTPAAKVLKEKALPSSDVDVFTENKKLMEETVMRLGGKKSLDAMDIHEFPSGYPNVGQKVNSQQQMGSYLFGNRYRSNPLIDEITIGGKTEGYEGKTSFEHLNVQFRKLSSAVRDDVADPMNKGYRLGKDVSRLTRVRDVLEEQRLIRNPKAKSDDTGIRNLLKQEITYKTESGEIKTGTLENIRAMYEAGHKKAPAPKPVPYSAGVAPSTFMALSGASLVPSLIRSVRPAGVTPASASPVRSSRSPSRSAIPSAPSVSPSKSASKASKSASPMPYSPAFPSVSPASLQSPKSASQPSRASSPSKYPSPSAPSWSPSPSKPSTPSKPPSPSTPTPPSPSMPSVPYTPPPTPPVSPFSWSGGIPGSGGMRRRRSAFLETFNMGLDVGGSRRMVTQGKSFSSPAPKKRGKRRK